MTPFLELIVVLAAVGALLVGACWLILRAGDRDHYVDPRVDRTPRPPTEPPPAPPKATTAPPKRVTLTLVSGSGRRRLGTVEILATQRRPVFRHRTPDGLLGTFVAAGTTDRGFVYRRVGVEREH